MLRAGTYKRLDRTIDRATGAEADRLWGDLDAWLVELEHWTPCNRVEVVQACNIARHLIMSGGMFGETPELAEAAGHVLACLYGIIVNVRRGSREVARSLRMLPHSPEARQVQGSEAHALAAIGRAAKPTCALDRGPTVERRRAA